MPSEIREEILQRLRDRYDSMELLELINPDIEEVLDLFEERIIYLLQLGELDVV